MGKREPQNPDWLYHTDLPPAGCSLHVRGVEEVECGGRQRVALRFRYLDNSAPVRKVISKALVLNETNLKMMVKLHGRETTAWVNESVRMVIVPDTGHGFGPGIRIRPKGEDQ